MRTSFHHQSEAQHPKSSAIHKYAGRLPHLMTQSGHWIPVNGYGPKGWLAKRFRSLIHQT
jgi:hypothetical protein